MKHTIFQFRLRITVNQPDALLRNIADKLKSIKGVDNAEGDLSEPSIAFRVHVSFLDANAAMKIHRKIVSTLVKTEGIAVTQATSNLTDVFGN